VPETSGVLLELRRDPVRPSETDVSSGWGDWAKRGFHWSECAVGGPRSSCAQGRERSVSLSLARFREARPRIAARSLRVGHSRPLRGCLKTLCARNLFREEVGSVRSKEKRLPIFWTAPIS
jgi:hypothetical protein